MKQDHAFKDSTTAPSQADDRLNELRRKRSRLSWAPDKLKPQAYLVGVLTRSVLSLLTWIEGAAEVVEITVLVNGLQRVPQEYEAYRRAI